MQRVPVKPQMLRWAVERSKIPPELLEKKLPKITQWLDGDLQPTLKQLEKFAKTTRTPVGYLFLAEPPAEPIPLPDFRVMPTGHDERPSPDMLETIYLCQQRQSWYRDFARTLHEEPLSFVGSARLSDSTEKIASDIRVAAKLELTHRSGSWSETLRYFVNQSDQLGVLVMVSGIVGSNTHRKLDPEEFRGFALVDDLAPLVFINGADTKAAQIFTLAHELAHIWIGQTAISNVALTTWPNHKIERKCNRIAAEVLVPQKDLLKHYNPQQTLQDELNRLARLFKVSTLVILRCLYDTRQLTSNQFQEVYHQELERLLAIPRNPGGDYYRSQPARVSKRFARALLAHTFEGRTPFSEAFRLLGVKKFATFQEMGRRLGVNG